MAAAEKQRMAIATTASTAHTSHAGTKSRLIVAGTDCAAPGAVGDCKEHDWSGLANCGACCVCAAGAKGDWFSRIDCGACSVCAPGDCAAR
jgi:hypothetical protein